MSKMYDVTISTVITLVFLPATLYLWEALVLSLCVRFKAFGRFVNNYAGIAALLTFIPCLAVFTLLGIAFLDYKCLWLRYFYNNQWCASEAVSDIIKFVVCGTVIVASFFGSDYVFTQHEKIEEELQEKVSALFSAKRR